MIKNVSVTLTDEILEKYKKNHSVFIETGTYLGGAVSMALEHGFESIYSIDISYGDRNKEYFKEEIQSGKVKLFC
jgi:predicted rRNA methylase YqxC with S4 and FtsJ domains